jgi:hypothetical protein
MQVRVITVTGATEIDAGVDLIRDQVLPIVATQQGYRGTTVSADRANDLLGIITMWDTVEDRDASNDALAQSRIDVANAVGGSFTVANFEQVVLEAVGMPAVGSALSVSRLSMSPENVDDNIAYFKSTPLPDMLATPGVLAVRMMVNRETGDAIVGMVFADHDSLSTAAGDAASRREAATARGIQFGDVSIREILLIDVR